MLSGALRCLVITFAACLTDKVKAIDDDVMRKRFTHIVNRQRGDTGAGQRLHFHARLMRYLGSTIDRDITVRIDFDVDSTTFQANGMAERNQLMGFLRGHRSGDNGGLKTGPFAVVISPS